MYSPYLKGKQFEFLAIRELACEFGAEEKRKVLPIIEPVKRSTRDASTAFKELIQADWPFALVLNPHLGDFQRGDNDYYSVVCENLAPYPDKWIPAFLLDERDDISGKISAENFGSIMAILPKDEQLDKWEDFLRLDVVKYIVICNADSSSLLRKIKHLGDGKILIRLDDCFQAEAKNALYAGKEDQFFNDNHAVYTEDGLAGFADYTTLPSKFIEGGVSPTVVAIHLTYMKGDEEIRIRHFLSDPNAKSKENTQGKFYEAGIQIGPFFNEHLSDRTDDVSRLIEFVNNSHFPGLGSIKKYTMKHHITLMSRI